MHMKPERFQVCSDLAYMYIATYSYISYPFDPLFQY